MQAVTSSPCLAVAHDVLPLHSANSRTVSAADLQALVSACANKPIPAVAWYPAQSVLALCSNMGKCNLLMGSMRLKLQVNTATFLACRKLAGVVCAIPWLADFIQTHTFTIPRVQSHPMPLFTGTIPCWHGTAHSCLKDCRAHHNSVSMLVWNTEQAALASRDEAAQVALWKLDARLKLSLLMHFDGAPQGSLSHIVLVSVGAPTGRMALWTSPQADP